MIIQRVYTFLGHCVSIVQSFSLLQFAITAVQMYSVSEIASSPPIFNPTQLLKPPLIHISSPTRHNPLTMQWTAFFIYPSVRLSVCLLAAENYK